MRSPGENVFANRLKAVASQLSRWTAVTMVGCLSLVLIDYWRDQGTMSLPLLRGTHSNLLAIPTLAFGFLMFRYAQRSEYTRSAAAGQDRYSGLLLVTMTIGIVLWQFLQMTSKLVVDPLNLVATALGTAGTMILYRTLRPNTFVSDSSC